MKSTTSKFKQIMASGNARDYVVKVDLTLADDPNTPTVLHLTEEDIWNDTFKIETASSGTSSFDIGTAVIGQCKFSLNNFDERFNQYDFFNASAVVWVGLKGDTDNSDHQVYYRLGFYTVDEPTYAGALIQLILLDNMWKFDVPFANVTLNYPVTALSAVQALCSYCGVSLSASSAAFHGKDFSIAAAPKDVENMNCREMLQYIAMIGCNFCVINSSGELELKWYDTASIPSESDLDGGTFSTTSIPYSDGDNADGGNFTDYTSGDEYDGGTFTGTANTAYFTYNFNTQFGTDVITITGVKFVIDETEYDIGSAGYVLELQNPLVNADNVSTVLNLIWDVLENFSLRTFNLTTASDLSVEVGDCCAIKDYKGNYIYSWVTNNYFAFANHMVQCNAVNPTRTLTKQYSKAVQAAVEVARQVADEEISNYDLDVQMMNDLAVNAMGGYIDYEDLVSGGRVWYLSNMPITKTGNTCSFQTGSTVFKTSGSGFFVSTDGGITWTNGYNTQTGKLVVNVLSAIGINFDWARGGTLTLGGYGNGNGILSILNSANVEKVHGDNDGISVGSNGANDSKVKLTTDGVIEYFYGGTYAGEMEMSAVNYGTQENPDIRDTLLIHEFNDINIRSDDNYSHIDLSTDSTNEKGTLSLYAKKKTGEMTSQYSSIDIDGDGIHFEGAIYTNGSRGIDRNFTSIGRDWKRYENTVVDGLLVDRYATLEPEVPHFNWHYWEVEESGQTVSYNGIILGAGVTSATFPDIDTTHTYEPFIQVADGESPPKITDIVKSGTSITVSFTAITSAQAAGNACVIKLMEYIV